MLIQHPYFFFNIKCLSELSDFNCRIDNVKRLLT
jgi:hypothetical protein